MNIEEIICFNVPPLLSEEKCDNQSPLYIKKYMVYGGASSVRVFGMQGDINKPTLMDFVSH